MKRHRNNHGGILECGDMSPLKARTCLRIPNAGALNDQLSGGVTMIRAKTAR
jgi:hypothetical protein